MSNSFFLHMAKLLIQNIIAKAIDDSHKADKSTVNRGRKYLSKIVGGSLWGMPTARDPKLAEQKRGEMQKFSSHLDSLCAEPGHDERVMTDLLQLAETLRDTLAELSRNRKSELANHADPKQGQTDEVVNDIKVTITNTYIACQQLNLNVTEFNIDEEFDAVRYYIAAYYTSRINSSDAVATDKKDLAKRTLVEMQQEIRALDEIKVAAPSAVDTIKARALEKGIRLLKMEHKEICREHTNRIGLAFGSLFLSLASIDFEPSPGDFGKAIKDAGDSVKRQLDPVGASVARIRAKTPSPPMQSVEPQPRASSLASSPPNSPQASARSPGLFTPSSHPDTRNPFADDSASDDEEALASAVSYLGGAARSQ